MIPEHCQLVRESWRSVESSAAEFPGVFYAHLFALDPSLREMFGDDPTTQGAKLVDTLNLLVENVERPTTIGAYVERLGRLHQQLGVLDAHYDLAEQALVAALEFGLGRKLSGPERTAWAHAYAALAEPMMAAGREQSRHGSR